MTYLKFYQKEQVLYAEAYNEVLDYESARIVFEKLRRHYKFKSMMLEFVSGSRGRCYSTWHGYRIQLPFGASVGLLCHEFAHALNDKKGYKRGHNKRLMRTLGSLVNYCKRKNYWREEIARRTEVKVKPVPSKEEQQLKKIEKRKTDLARYEKKLKYYTKLYTNKIKKAKRSIMMLERHCKKED